MGIKGAASVFGESRFAGGVEKGWIKGLSAKPRTRDSTEYGKEDGSRAEKEMKEERGFLAKRDVPGRGKVEEIGRRELRGIGARDAEYKAAEEPSSV